jgi:hypothetical protein
MPPLGQPGEICWMAIRNLIENPDHAVGPGKERPGILFDRLNDGRWRVIGTTSKAFYATGTPRTRIRADLWEASLPLYKPGYLWGGKIAVIPNSDIGDRIGFANPELRAIASRQVVGITPTERNQFLRLQPGESASHVDTTVGIC